MQRIGSTSVYRNHFISHFHSANTGIFFNSKSEEITIAINHSALIAASDHPRAQDIFNILTLLDMPAALQKISSDLDIHDLLKHALPRQALQSLVKRPGFTVKKISIGPAFTERKLQHLLSPQHSEPLSPLEVGNSHRFMHTLNTCLAQRKQLENGFFKPKAAIPHRPIDLQALCPGIGFVMRYLNQIDHGVYI
ncbi:MAG: hypothetical protein QM709_11875 [Spongiibacteraceae bacterium]